MAQFSGICQCGCGAHTLPSVTGTPLRFVRGHWSRKAKVDRYRKVLKDGSFTYLHRLKAERALGKPLPTGAHVHHTDPDHPDSSPLVICQDAAYHKLLHRRMRAKQAGGNPETDRYCPSYKEAKPFGAFGRDRTTSTGLAVRCMACNRARWMAYSETIYARRKSSRAAR